VWLFSSFPMPRRAAVVADDFAGHPVLVFKTASRYESRLALKRAVDLAGASLLVVLLSPLLLAIALGVKLGSPGRCSSGRSARAGAAAPSRS
jgi:putative colanic acid biosynthesis UDP-glucose lipid carrier transferase